MPVSFLVAAGLFLCGARAGLANPSEAVDETGEKILATLQKVGKFRQTKTPPDHRAFELMDDQGHALGALYVNSANSDLAARFHSTHFNISIGNFAPDSGIIDKLVQGAQAVAAWDGGARPDGTPHQAMEHLDELFDATLLFLVLAFLLALRRGTRISTDFRLPHVIQVIAQGGVFVYWLIYWPAVGSHLPSLALQLVFAYACDATFCLLRFRSWRVGLGVIPVVFSTNLFEWFDWHALVIAFPVAFASKTFLHRKGRHIFNPSVAGLTAVGLISIFVPNFVHFGSDFHTLNIPPNMAEFVVLIALIPQLRFRIIPVSIGAILACHATGNPAVVRPAIILAFTLLASDPVTTPTTDIGKLLFGCVVGFGLPVLSIVMRHIAQPDDFAKVMAVAAGNFLAPTLDSIARVLVRGAAQLRDAIAREAVERWAFRKVLIQQLAGLASRPIPNMVLVGCWLMICVPWIAQEKARDFEPALHWNWNTPLVVRDADDVPRCEHNPVFCQPFSFPQELSLWLQRARAGRTTTASAVTDANEVMAER